MSIQRFPSRRRAKRRGNLCLRLFSPAESADHGRNIGLVVTAGVLARYRFFVKKKSLPERVTFTPRSSSCSTFTHMGNIAGVYCQHITMAMEMKAARSVGRLQWRLSRCLFPVAFTKQTSGTCARFSNESTPHRPAIGCCCRLPLMYSPARLDIKGFQSDYFPVNKIDAASTDVLLWPSFAIFAQVL